jgi:hypothetical protein
VRQRARVATDPGGSQRGWRCIDWAKWGTIAGILVGAVGLLLTGVATFYDARVSALQLGQSRDDAEADARRQAARVASWGDLELRVHVVNRSPEPVSDVEVRFRAGYFQDAPDGIIAVREAFRLTVPYLPPCSELVVSPDQLLDGAAFVPLDVTFTDSVGVKWVRMKAALERAGSPEGRIATERLEKEYGAGTAMDALDSKPTIKKAEPCTAVLG